MGFKKAKKFIIEKAKDFHPCKSELQKVIDSENMNELLTVLRKNHRWIYKNKFLTDEESIKHIGFSLSNLFNSGNSNSGNSNSGNSNSGNWNSGDRNSGSCNSGIWNSGDSNSGYSNSGDWNSGDWNSGYSNSGDRNSGNWNSGNSNSGFFNSETPETIKIFNKDCSKKEWDDVEKPKFIYRVFTNVWIIFSEMNEQEKKDNKNAFVTNGYLKQIEYKEAWKIAFEKATKEDIELLKKLPNFDSKVFKEITGIEIL